MCIYIHLTFLQKYTFDYFRFFFYLDVQKFSDLEANSRAMDRRIIVGGSVIAHVCPHCERYRFRLNKSEYNSIIDIHPTSI